MLRQLIAAIMLACLCSTSFAYSAVPAEFEKINTYREMRNYATANFAHDETCMDQYNQRIKNLRLKLLMQPIRMTVGFVAAPIVGTLGGALVGAYHGGGAVGEFGAHLLTALGIDITQVMDPELGYKLAVEYGIQPLEAVNTAVGAGVGAFAVTFLYHAIKTTVIVSKIISAKKAAKLSFLGHIGGGKKLDKLVKKINKRVNRKLSKEGYSQITITNEEISALLVEADRNELYCTGAMKRSRSATELDKPLRKKLAKRSDIYRYLTNSILEMY